MNAQLCPICSKPVPPSERYPRRVCLECAAKAQARDGRPLKFYNESLSGGFIAVYADTGEKYPGHECTIDGVECRADEARFGGILIQTLE